MYFSIGGHPAFKCPMTLAGSRSDYYLVFNKEENTATHMLEDGLFSGETGMALEGTKLPITQNLFDHDALVYKDLNSTNVSLWSADKRWFKFHYQGFPYLGIWSKNQVSPFVCIEPWFGLADSHDHDGEISKKEGIMLLEAHENFTCEPRPI